jgi:[protein-PII] uridylyltransferase
MQSPFPSSPLHADPAQCVARWVAQHHVQVETFLHDHRLAPLWRGLTGAADSCIAALVPANATYAVLAVGGYGRRELFPHSDIDILILMSHGDHCDLPPWLYALWDSPFRIGHQMHSIVSATEAALHEQTIATNFLDARFVAGDTRIAQRFRRAYRRARFQLSVVPYIEAKLHERDVRHTRFGDSRFILEPHIKEGKGGLRDLQTLEWIARYASPVRSMRGCVREGIISEASWRIFERNLRWLSRVRALMHAQEGRAAEQLTFTIQTRLAEALHIRGDTPERRAEKLMQRYFSISRDTGHITREFIAGLEETGLRPVASHKRLVRPIAEGLELRGSRLHIADAASLAEHPMLALKLFEMAHMQEHDVHPASLRMLRDNLPILRKALPHLPEANETLLRLLLGQAPSTILRRMHEAGVLTALLPEFAHVEGQMQYDGYHTYTVDEHTLVAIGNLNDFESGACQDELPTTTEAAKLITHRRALYVAMLCHDLAKGMGGGHATKAVPLTHALARRIGLDESEAILAGWLVENHLLLTDAAFKRDLEDPQTVQRLVAAIQSPERLRLLLMLTVADVRAVGPNIWNKWKAALLREVYTQTLAAMGVRTKRSIAAPEYHESEAIAALMQSGERVAVHVEKDTARAVTTLTCAMAHGNNYLRQVTGLVSNMGGNIVSARTLVMEQASVITLSLQDVHGNAFDDLERLRNVPSMLQQLEAGSWNFEPALAQTTRVRTEGKKRPVAPSVFVDNNASTQASIIEVNGEDRPALLYDILQCFHDLTLQVQSAHIATYGQKAVDVFYVKDKYGMKLMHRNKQQEVIETVRNMLDAKATTGQPT